MIGVRAMFRFTMGVVLAAVSLTGMAAQPSKIFAAAPLQQPFDSRAFPTQPAFIQADGTAILTFTNLSPTGNSSVNSILISPPANAAGTTIGKFIPLSGSGPTAVYGTVLQDNGVTVGTVVLDAATGNLKVNNIQGLLPQNNSNPPHSLQVTMKVAPLPSAASWPSGLCVLGFPVQAFAGNSWNGDAFTLTDYTGNVIAPPAGKTIPQVSETFLQPGCVTTYMITASSGPNGSVTPVGVTQVVSGGGQIYAITPATGYHVADVLVDTVSVGAVTSYTFSNVTANHTISAAFSADTYPVTYSATGADSGSAPSAQTKTYGVDLTLATNTGSLTKAGNTFDGWNTQPDGSGTSYAAGGTYSGNAALTLYAKWKINTYPVTYSATGADSGSAPSAQTKTYGVDLTLATNTGSLAKAGNTFDGWNTQPDGSGTNYAAGGTYSGNAALTLYAKWKINTYPVTYSAIGADSGSAPSAQTKTYGVDLTLATNTGSLAKAGNTFDGWNTQQDGNGTNYAAGGTYSGNAALTLYAKWKINTYPVTYSAIGADSGSAPSAQTKTYGVDLTLATNTGSLAKAGNTFDGWNTQQDGNGINYAAGGTYSGNAALTLYAKWKINTYPVTYNANGADSGAAPANQTKTYGVDLTLATNTGSLAKAGNTFDGWNTQQDGNGTNYAAGGTYSGNAALTLYAKWTANTYPVTYNANGADSGAAPANQTKTYGVDLTLATNSGGLVKNGYTFAGWNTATDGSGTSYAAGGTYSGNAALALYAKWAAIAYPLSYNGNGDTGGTQVPTVQVPYNTAAIVAANTFTKTCNTFVNWKDTGAGTTYAPNDSITMNSTSGIILTAQWAVIPYAVTFDFNSGTGVISPNPQPVNCGSNATQPADPTRSGYKFTGWTLNGSAFDFGTPITASIRLVATWSKDTLKLSAPSTATVGVPFPVNVTVDPGNSQLPITLGSSDCTIQYGSPVINSDGTTWTFQVTITSTAPSNKPQSSAPGACTISASDTSGNYSSDSVKIPKVNGSLTCYPQTGSTAGNLEVLHSPYPYAYFGDPDWGLLRSDKNKDGSPCAFPVAYDFIFNPTNPNANPPNDNSAAFVVTATNGEAPAVEYVLVWNPIKVNSPPPPNYLGPGYPWAQLAWVKDTSGNYVYVPGLWCVEDDVDQGYAIMPQIPNIAPFNGQLGTDYPAYAPWKDPAKTIPNYARMCVAHEGVTTVGKNGNGVILIQYEDRIIDVEDGGVRLTN